MVATTARLGWEDTSTLHFRDHRDRTFRFDQLPSPRLRRMVKADVADWSWRTCAQRNPAQAELCKGAQVGMLRKLVHGSTGRDTRWTSQK